MGGLAPERDRPDQAEPLRRDAADGLGEPATAPLRVADPVARACATAARSASPGFHDWTIDGVHLCTTRLNLLRLNTMRRARPGAARRRRRRCGSAPAAELRELGRLALPDAPPRGRAGFSPGQLGRGARPSSPTRIRASRRRDRIGFFLTARGITNEVYYVAQKVARFLGTNNVDNAARICHAPSTGALKHAIGVGRDDHLATRT